MAVHAVGAAAAVQADVAAGNEYASAAGGCRVHDKPEISGGAYEARVVGRRVVGAAQEQCAPLAVPATRAGRDQDGTAGADVLAFRAKTGP